MVAAGNANYTAQTGGFTPSTPEALTAAGAVNSTTVTPQWESYNPATGVTTTGTPPVSGDQGTTVNAAGTPSAGAQVTVPSDYHIPFKPGANQTQMTSIANLLNNKPSSQWTQTDIDNWNFATNNAPLPNFSGAGTNLELPDDIKTSPEYQNLSADLQAMVDLVYMQMNAQTAEEQRLASDALEAARQYADPYYRVMLNFAVDSIPDQFKTTKASVEDQILTSQERLREIEASMEDLTLEQQQTLGEIKTQYEQNIRTAEENAADAGLAYSSKRADLEKYIADQNKNMIASTERGYNTQMRNYETAQTQQERQENLIRQAGEAQLRAIARGAEETIGTTNYQNLGLTDLSGNTIAPIGGAQGSIDMERQSAILNLASTLQNYERPQEITNLLNT